MSRFYTNVILSKFFLNVILIIAFNISFAQYTPNPKVKVNYKVARGTMRSYNTTTSTIGNTGGACTETGGLEIRVHAQFRSSTGITNGSNASYNATNTCPSGTCAACATGTAQRWSCEQRCEASSNAGTCGTWVVNGSQNASYPGDPGYVDTSLYPVNDVLEIQMKGFESDNFITFVNSDVANYNYNDGACQTTCANGNCYGNYQIPTSGRYTNIDVGTVSNTLAPYCGSNWSSYYDAAYEGTACALDLTGYRSYYYLQWQYRWCWDASTLFDRHAGGIKVPTILEYCSGATVAVADSIEGFEVTRGFSSYQWETNNGTGWIDIAGATSKDLSTTSLTNTTVAPITYQIRRATLFCTDFLATPTKTRVYSNIITIIVYPQPVAPTLYVAGTSPANGTTICKGLFVYAQFNSGTGGYTDATDVLQYSIDNGANWNNYTAGNSINTASATTAVLVRVARTAGSLSTCNATPWTTLVSWPISTAAVPPSITTSIPSNNTSICLSGVNQITGTISEGSGGTGYEYGYSINNATTPSTITTGTPPTSNFVINTSGATTKINLFGRRTGVGAGSCSPTPWALIGEWQIVNQPNSPTLNAQTPTATNVLEGDIVSATANSGSGGASNAADEYRISSDDGNTWSSYTIGSDYTVPIGATVVIIQARRNTGTSYGCSNSDWSDLATWNVDVVLPVELVSFTAHKNENTNYLNWITASESNAKEFILQKSNDFNDWLEIAKIQAVGNSSQNQYYHFYDYNNDNIINYYRLKLVDIDNSFKYSNIVSIDNRNTLADKLILFPNPTNTSVRLTSSIEFYNFSIIKIVDVIGNTVRDIIIDKNNNNKLMDIDCTKLPKGNYFICIYDNSSRLINTLKLVKY